MSEGGDVRTVIQELRGTNTQDPLEGLISLITQMADDEKATLLMLADDNERRAFEVRCKVFASFSNAGIKDGEASRQENEGKKFATVETSLDAFLKRYNHAAGKLGRRTYAIQYAYELGRVGKKMDEGGRRMVDFPAVPPAFYTEALRASNFFDALQLAQDNISAHERDPERVDPFSYRMFRKIISPEPRRAARQVSPDPAPSPQPSDIVVEAERTPEIQMSAAGAAVTPPPVVNPVVQERPEPQEIQPEVDEKPTPAPADSSRTCYTCDRCVQVEDDQRLAVVVTAPDGKTMREFLCAFAPCDAWFCQKRRILLSINARQEEAARGRAAACDSYFTRGEAQPDSDASGEGLSADDILDLPPDIESAGDPGEAM